MNKECFFKGHSSLHRKIIAGALSATFCSGMCCGNYAVGAMDELSSALINLNLNIGPTLDKNPNENVCKEFRKWVDANAQAFLEKIPNSKAVALIMFTDEELEYMRKYKDKVDGLCQQDLVPFLLNKFSRKKFLELFTDCFFRENCSEKNLDNLKKKFESCFTNNYSEDEVSLDKVSLREVFKKERLGFSKEEKEKIRELTKKDGAIEHFVWNLSIINDEYVEMEARRQMYEYEKYHEKIFRYISERLKKYETQPLSKASEDRKTFKGTEEEFRKFRKEKFLKWSSERDKFRETVEYKELCKEMENMIGLGLEARSIAGDIRRRNIREMFGKDIYKKFGEDISSLIRSLQTIKWSIAENKLQSKK